MDPNVIGPNEQVIRILRRHPISLFPVLVAMVVLAVAVLYGFYCLGRYGDKIAAIVSLQIVSMVLLAVMALIGVILILSFYVYSQSKLILTNENLVQIKQIGIFNRRVSALNLKHIEDVTGQVHGLFATLLGFGNIIVETAGEQENFIFGPVADPYPMVELINRTHQDFEQKVGGHR